MKKLVQLNATANWGSTGKIAEGIGRVAMSRGWESHIAYGRMMNPGESQLIRVGRYADNVLHYLRDRIFDGEGLGSRKPTERLISELKRIEPDVVHLHNIHDHWLNYPMLFKYLANADVQVVWTFHDCWAFTGHCSYFDEYGCEKWINGCHNCPMPKHGLDRSSRNYQLKKTLTDQLSTRLTIVPVSRWLSDFVSKSFLAGHSIKTIHNGVDLRVFNPNNADKKDKLILGVALPWSERKGLSDFMELRKILPAEYRIVLIGLTDKQIASLPEGIEGKTRTQNVEELVRYYSSALAFVNPTHCDTFPTVNLEALACGTPVITYRTGGSPEAVDSNTGLVVEQGDVAGLRDAVLAVGRDAQRFTSRMCRERAERCFDRDRQFGLYVDLYETLLKNK